jgi:hypothetical protein
MHGIKVNLRVGFDIEPAAICKTATRKSGDANFLPNWAGNFAEFTRSLQDFARAQPTFLTQNLHQPAGLISPSTSVHEFGSWNREQLLHR